MKRLLKNILAVFIFLLVLSSCYDDYQNDFEYTATYFSMQSPLRTLIVNEEEPTTFEIGAMLGGRYVNENTETVEFIIDPTILQDPSISLELLPENYYELSNESQITIPSGEVLGKVTVTLSEAFFNDELAHTVHYALPVRIVSTSLDSILPNQDHTIIAVKYENKYYGAYRVKGVDYTLDASQNITNTFRYSVDDLHQNIYTTSGTLAKDTCTLPYIGSDITAFNSIKLSVSGDGNVLISPHEVQSNVVVSGTGKYEPENKVFYLDYTYEKAGEMHQVYDTLYHFAYPMDVETWR